MSTHASLMQSQIQTKTTALSWLSVFTSAGTLLCCALPAALVAIGAGASLASLLGVFPQLVWVSENKSAVFIFAAAMLAVAGYFQLRNRRAPCPVDPVLARECMRTRTYTSRIYLVSLAIFLVGGFFAFVAPLINAG